MHRTTLLKPRRNRSAYSLVRLKDLTIFLARMSNPIRIGLVGDFDANVPAHRAIPLALGMAAKAVDCIVKWEWIGTHEIHGSERLESLNGLWCVPASPYRNMQGALSAIKYARENKRPFLGTCGGFQHAVIEYARYVLGVDRRRACRNSTRCRSPCHCAT